MIQITYQDFMRYLLSYDRCVPGEMLTENFIAFEKEYLSDQKPMFFYYSGCVCSYDVQSSNESAHIYCFIYQVADNCDLENMIIQCKEKIEAERLKYPSIFPCLFASVKFSLSEKYAPNLATIHFSYIGMKSSDNINPNIKVLDSEYKNEIIRMCEPYKNADTEFGKQLAQTFSDYDWEGHHQFLGFYDEKKLVGIVSYHFCEKADLAYFCNIFVIPEYRKKGVGKILLLETLSKYPNKRWLYQASICNTPSQELALSVGFIKSGALLVFDL